MKKSATNKPKLIQLKSRPKLFFSFVKPDQTALDEIVKVLEEMPIVPMAEVEPFESVTPRQGSLNKTMELLNDILRLDYEQTVEDVKEWDGGFDYVVEECDFQTGAVQVLTRLFHPEKGGNIFYGRIIQRVSENTFLLWDAED